MNTTLARPPIAERIREAFLKAPTSNPPTKLYLGQAEARELELHIKTHCYTVTESKNEGQTAFFMGLEVVRSSAPAGILIV